MKRFVAGVLVVVMLCVGACAVAGEGSTSKDVINKTAKLIRGYYDLMDGVLSPTIMSAAYYACINYLVDQGMETVSIVEDLRRSDSNIVTDAKVKMLLNGSNLAIWTLTERYNNWMNGKIDDTEMTEFMMETLDSLADEEEPKD